MLDLFPTKSIPKGATVAQNFDAAQYLGAWHEIARIDFKQERNLNKVGLARSAKDFCEEEI